jgi:hypothetical protein
MGLIAFYDHLGDAIRRFEEEHGEGRPEALLLELRRQREVVAYFAENLRTW